jgi:dTDP-4-dehydrorhamnose 3,5-epimerase
VEIRQTSLPGVLLIQPRVHADARGYLFESYRHDVLAKAGVPPFVQDNQSLSSKDTLRGLHYQLDRPQAKLVRVIRGAVYDVAVDIRKGSPTFGRWFGETLTAENKLQLFVPVGFAHGFCVLEDGTEVLYKCADYYSGPADQRGVLWNDPSLAIDWPCDSPLVSDKDRTLLPLTSDRGDLPDFAAKASAPQG